MTKISPHMTYEEKQITRYKTSLAIKRGDIKKTVCDICGDTKVAAHHRDYENYLDVVFLCKKHHREAHGYPEVSTNYTPKRKIIAMHQNTYVAFCEAKSILTEVCSEIEDHVRVGDDYTMRWLIKTALPELQRILAEARNG